jgi:hypothetical protein
MILNNTIECAMTICCLNLSLVLHAAKNASVFLAFLDFPWGSQKQNYEMEFDRLSILNLPFWPSTGGKLTKLNIPEGSFELTTQREGAAFCGNLFFHAKNDCCSLEGTCKPVTSS